MRYNRGSDQRKRCRGTIEARRRWRMQPTLLALEDRTLLSTTWSVTSLADDGSSGTLRYEIGQANATAGDNIINFSVTGTITLSGTQLELNDTSGDPNQRIEIDGPGANLLSVSGNNASRVFQIHGGVTASISGLTITGGGLFNDGTANLTDCTVSGNSGYYGGGLWNDGTANLTDCTVSGNSAGYNGGGLFNDGTANLTNCTISGNSAGYNGGGLSNYGTANLTDCTISGNSASAGGGLDSTRTATLTNCTVSGNSAGAGLGGGLLNRYGTATLSNCTVSGNSAFVGGGLLNRYGTATLSNCTVSGNSALVIGGLANSNYGTAALTNCTVSGNSASSNHGGGYIGGLGNYGTATLTNTIVVGNTTSPNDGGSASDIGGPTSVSGSYNLIGTGGSGGLTDGVNHNQVGIADPLLGTLGNYGGPTQTIPLLPGSPAIGAGSPALAVDPSTGQALTADQRGYTPSSMADIGAFQDQGFVLTPVAGSTPQSAVAGTTFANPLAVTVTANNTSQFTNPVDGGVISDTANPATNGASASLSAATAVITAVTVNGQTSEQASVTAAANAVAGSYTVTASAAGVTTPASFSLTNNPSVASQTINFTAPASPIAFAPSATVTLSATASSGLTVVFTIDTASTGTGSISGNTLTVTGAGTFVLDANQAGNANYSAAPQVQQTLVVTPANTTTTLASSANPAVPGQSVTFTAIIAAVAPDGGTPTGSVTFTSNGTTLSPVTYSVVGGSLQASVTTSYASAGTPAITATYQNSDGNYQGSSGSLTQTVLAPGVSVSGTVLYIVVGSTSSDTASVKRAGAKADGTTGLAVCATLNGVSVSKTFTQTFTAIVLAGYAGNETFTLASTLTLPTTVTAGNGNDTIQLGGGNSTVTLGNGNDTVSAGGGNNTVTLGSGNDTMALGNGSNVVVEGNGNDTVSAGNGNNLIVGGLGRHTIRVGNGTNILIDGSAAITNSGDSFRQILSDWTANPTASNQGAIRQRFTVNYNTKYANTLSAGSGIDWFFYKPPTTSNKKSTDFLN